jgi:hypothetical protein
MLRLVLYQGTTLVGPFQVGKNVGLQPLRGRTQLDFLAENKVAVGGLLRQGKSVGHDLHGNHNGTHLILQGQKRRG